MARLAIVGVFVLLLDHADTANGADTPAEFRAVRDHIAAQVAEGRAASVAVVRADRIVWAEGFGLANRDAHTPATPDSIYRLASISKPLTATGLMILVERGTVDLDAPANRHLAGSPLRAGIGSADAMTVRRIANHTSGLPVHFNFFFDGRATPPMAETIRLYGFASTEPGRVGEYSNLGYGILGHIVEATSNTPWREFMDREVYDRLGMTRTSDRVRPGREADAAISYTKDAAGLVVAPGFIDMMGQTAAPFLKDPRAGDNLLTQGITTINAGEGDSDAPLAGEGEGADADGRHPPRKPGRAGDDRCESDRRGNHR